MIRYPSGFFGTLEYAFWQASQFIPTYKVIEKCALQKTNRFRKSYEYFQFICNYLNTQSSDSLLSWNELYIKSQ